MQQHVTWPAGDLAGSALVDDLAGSALVDDLAGSMLPDDLAGSMLPDDLAGATVVDNAAGNFVPWTQADVEQLVPDRFEQQARRYGDRLAVKATSEALTYEALNRAANRLAHAILGDAGHDEAPVALLMEHGAAMIVAILGALKAGRMYVPLDPASPQPRLAAILADAEATLVLTNHANAALARTIGGPATRLLDLDELNPDLPDDNPARPAALTPDAISNIVYTSGSTGEPKGAIQTHRNVLFEVAWSTNRARYNAEDRFTLLTPYTVHVGTVMMCNALLNGATLLPFDVKREGIPALASWLAREKLTIYHSVPTVFRHLLGSLGSDDLLPHLRFVQLGGEPASAQDVLLMRRHVSRQCVLRVGLGSTEAGLATHCLIGAETELPGTSLPLGRPSPGRQILILGDDGAPVPAGEVGEIAIKSRYLALGYSKRPEQTRAVFLPADQDGARTYLTGDLGRILSDGNVEHLGRKDTQVKIRGHRVEIAEIETWLRRIEGVREAAVAVKRDHLGEDRLVAYVVPAGQPAPSVAALRQTLATTLPDHMVPGVVVWMSALPQVLFGKIDRRALPDPDWESVASDSAYVAPRTPLEEELARIWSDVLGVKQIGVATRFFDLGGDSLRATQVIGRVNALYQVAVPISTFFEAPTVADLALLVAQSLAESIDDDDEIARLLAELEASGDGAPGAQLAGEAP